MLRDADSIVKQNALDELGELGDQKAVAFIQAYLHDKEEQVRQAAKTAMDSLRA